MVKRKKAIKPPIKRRGIDAVDTLPNDDDPILGEICRRHSIKHNGFDPYFGESLKPATAVHQSGEGGMLPYGTNDIEAGVSEKYGSGSNEVLRKEQIRCCIKGCAEWLSKRHRKGRSANDCYCAKHGISVSNSPTYVYKDHERNFIVKQDLLKQVHKVERWRLGNEKSEDAISWNVFLSLQGMNALGDFTELVTGRKAEKEPVLYMWGNRISGTGVGTWGELLKLREHLEKGLQFATEPDIAIHVPGQFLMFCEAKFTSANSIFKKGERADSIAGLLSRYKPPTNNPDPLNRKYISALPEDQVQQQLCRNVLFASWLAANNEDVWIVNLVREVAETDVESRFRPCLTEQMQSHFKRVTWEQIYRMVKSKGSGGDLLCRYMETKTAGLVKAFNI